MKKNSTRNREFDITLHLYLYVEMRIFKIDVIQFCPVEKVNFYTEPTAESHFESFQKPLPNLILF